MSTTPRQAPPLFSPEPAPRGRNVTAPWLVALGAICAVALALQIYHFRTFLADSVSISLNSGHWPLQGNGVMGHDLLPAANGYSDFLWVWMCAGLGALGMKLETAAHLLGITSTALGIAAVAAQVYRDFPAKVKFISALIGCLALCLSAPIAVWAMGGMEQPLLAALLAWAAYFGIRWVAAPKGHRRDADVMGILLGLAVLCRADAALFAVLFYAGAVLGDGVRTRTLIARARLLALPILVFVAQALLRYAYYGAWMPNTAYGNGAFTLQRLYRGLLYDIDGVGSQIVFLLLAIVGCVALSIAGKTRQVILLGTVCVGWLLYVMTIGGDVFPSYRHFVPAMALMGFLVAGCGLLTLAAPFRFSMARVVTFLLLTLLVLTSDLLATTVQGDRPGKPIGLFLHTASTARDSLSAPDAE